MKALTVLLASLWALGAAAQSDDSRDDGRPRRAPLAGAEGLEPAVDVDPSRVAVIDRARTPPRVAQGAVPVATSPPAPALVAPPPAVSELEQAPATAPRTSSPRVLDSIDLGTTSITGNQELPKVLYIVPWKKSDLGDLVGRPVNTLLDEVLAPVDPEVFERHLGYYESLYRDREEE